MASFKGLAESISRFLYLANDRIRIQNSMNTADHRRLLAKLTPKKLVNAAKLYGSYQLSRRLGKAWHSGMPLTLSIEPTTACNLRCPECPSGLRSFSRATGTMKVGFLDDIVGELSDTLLFLILYFQGEPFIHPRFLDMVHLAHQKNIYTITSTNGHFLDEHNAHLTVESGLDRLIISLDGSTQEVYETYRKAGDLSQVLDGTANLVAAKKKLRANNPHIIFQTLVLETNRHQIPDIYRLAKKLGVNEVKLKTAQFYDYTYGHPLMPKDDQYSRYQQNPDGTYRLKYKLQNQCWKMWHSAVVTWDGKVVPCCFDKDAKHLMGDLSQMPFSSIWASDTYHNFRTTILKGRSHIDICTNCSEGCKVWLTNDF